MREFARRTSFSSIGIMLLAGALAACDDDQNASVVETVTSPTTTPALSAANPTTNPISSASTSTTSNANATNVATAPQSGGRTASLSWSAPTEYEDGSTLTDLAGYRIFYGSAPGSYSKIAEVAPGTTSHKIYDLAATTYYFSITAYNHDGVESRLSNEVVISLN